MPKLQNHFLSPKAINIRDQLHKGLSQIVNAIEGAKSDDDLLMAVEALKGYGETDFAGPLRNHVMIDVERDMQETKERLNKLVPKK